MNWTFKDKIVIRRVLREMRRAVLEHDFDASTIPHPANGQFDATASNGLIGFVEQMAKKWDIKIDADAITPMQRGRSTGAKIMNAKASRRRN